VKACRRCSVVSDNFGPRKVTCRPCLAAKERDRRANRSPEQRASERQVIQQWEAAHRATVLDTHLRYRTSPRGRATRNLASQRRRAAKVNADTGCWYARETVARQSLTDPCVYCGGPGGQLEHIDALSISLDDTADNFAGACASCNPAKRDRRLLAFLLERVS